MSRSARTRSADQTGAEPCVELVKGVTSVWIRESVFLRSANPNVRERNVEMMAAGEIVVHVWKQRCVKMLSA